MAREKLYPYKRLWQVAEGLHCVEGTFGRSPLGRRMTAVVLPHRQVVVHSGIRMSEDDMAGLDALGNVRAIVVPNTLHGADAPWYADRYPDAPVLAPRGAAGKLRRRTRVDGTLEDDWPDAWRSVLDVQALQGLRMHEAAFFHAPSRSLILTDLVFNMGPEYGGLTRLLLTLNQAYDRFGPSRLARALFIHDPAALATSLQALEAWDYDRIIVSHGRILNEGGKAALREAFAYLPASG